MLLTRSIGVAVTILILATGCSGGRKIVPVSGRVTVDGQPARNVVVSFQPLGDENDKNPGRGSSAITDNDGRYSLVYDGDQEGALTGKHRVRIFPQFEGAADEPEEGAEEAPKAPKGGLRLSANIPFEWNETSTKEFDVPPGGTDKADFAIETKPASK